MAKKGTKFVIFTKELKQQFFEMYVDNGYNIRQTCADLGIAQSTFYDNLGRDDEFKQVFENTNEVALHAVQSTLLEAVNHEDWNIRRWAVERLMKSPKLSKMGLSETANVQGNNLLVVNREDIILE